MWFLFSQIRNLLSRKTERHFSVPRNWGLSYIRLGIAKNPDLCYFPNIFVSLYEGSLFPVTLGKLQSIACCIEKKKKKVFFVLFVISSGLQMLRERFISSMFFFLNSSNLTLISDDLTCCWAFYSTYLPCRSISFAVCGRSSFKSRRGHQRWIWWGQTKWKLKHEHLGLALKNLCKWLLCLPRLAL